MSWYEISSESRESQDTAPFTAPFTSALIAKLLFMLARRRNLRRAFQNAFAPTILKPSKVALAFETLDKGLKEAKESEATGK